MLKEFIYIICFIVTLHFIFYYLKVNLYDLLPTKEEGIECTSEITQLKETLNAFKNINPL